jgi:hypothetical protein
MRATLRIGSRRLRIAWEQVLMPDIERQKKLEKKLFPGQCRLYKA